MISKSLTEAIAICNPSVLYLCGITFSATYISASFAASSLGSSIGISYSKDNTQHFFTLRACGTSQFINHIARRECLIFSGRNLLEKFQGIGMGFPVGIKIKIKQRGFKIYFWGSHKNKFPLHIKYKISCVLYISRCLFFHCCNHSPAFGVRASRITLNHKIHALLKGIFTSASQKHTAAQMAIKFQCWIYITFFYNFHDINSPFHAKYKIPAYMLT